jgi:tetratricopeptide (TPR) repeat protein
VCRNCRNMQWEQRFERERARYDDGVRRLAPGQLLRLGNAAYGAGLCLLMLGRGVEAAEWFERAAQRWRESWEHAAPDSWGRPLGAIKALVLARRREQAVEAARWALELDWVNASSPIARYAAALALLVCERDSEAAPVSAALRAEDFPAETADALTAIAARHPTAYAVAVEAVLVSFETRDDFLDDVPVADTVLALQGLARTRGMTAVLRESALLPGTM